MNVFRNCLILASVMPLLAACGGTPAGLRAKAVELEHDHKGYLQRADLAALARSVPAPPAAGSPAAIADIAASQALKRYENSDRWLLATSHAEVRPPYALQHFDCALGLRFDPVRATTDSPATVRIFNRLFEDAEAASSIVKALNYRARPVGDDADRIACQTVSEAGRESASYPSGSATVASAYGAAMAVLSPDNADAALEIGRQIAFSRAICAMHYPQDVRAGLELGQSIFETARLSPDFQSDLAQARLEIASLKASGLTNPGCAAERRALSLGVQQDSFL